MDSNCFNRTSMENVFIANGDKIACEEDLCFCGENYYVCPIVENDEKRILIKSRVVADEEEDLSLEVIDFSYLTESSVESYLIYIGEELAPVMRELIIERIVKIIENSSFETLPQIMSTIAMGYNTTEELIHDKCTQEVIITDFIRKHLKIGELYNEFHNQIS